jgi:hypothetical protein
LRSAVTTLIVEYSDDGYVKKKFHITILYKELSDFPSQHLGEAILGQREKKWKKSTEVVDTDLQNPQFDRLAHSSPEWSMSKHE